LPPASAGLHKGQAIDATEQLGVALIFNGGVVIEDHTTRGHTTRGPAGEDPPIIAGEDHTTTGRNFRQREVWL